MSGTKIAVGRGNMKGFTCAEQLVKAEMIRTDNSETLKNALLKIKALEEQVDKMKCCENCAWWYRLPNGQKDCAEKCENLDNWSLRK